MTSSQQKDTTENTENKDESLAVEIDQRSTFHQISRIMLLHAKHTIDIFAFKLEPDIVNHESVINALKMLPRQCKTARLRVLVHESRETVSECAAFIEMARKYSSFVEFRRLGDLKETNPASWMTVDQDKYITRKNYHSYKGKASRQDKLQVRTLSELYDELWEKSLPDPELRRLCV